MRGLTKQTAAKPHRHCLDHLDYEAQAAHQVVPDAMLCRTVQLRTVAPLLVPGTQEAAAQTDKQAAHANT